MTAYRVPPMLSWQEFLDVARAPATIPLGDARHASSVWAGATWEEAFALAVDGWPLDLLPADVTVGDLRERAGLGVRVTVLAPTWDVTGSEVDIGAYLAGEPECMVDAVPRRTSVRGRVVTFLIPAGYASTVPHTAILNRGLALATLCASIIDAGHSVEIWSGDTGMVGAERSLRYSAVARVISAGEPLDLGRLVFALAHPAMCRRLWFSVWDGQDRALARLVKKAQYGFPPYACVPEDLPAEITDPYVFPYLEETASEWNDLDSALSWSRRTFAELGLIQ